MFSSILSKGIIYNSLTCFSIGNYDANNHKFLNVSLDELFCQWRCLVTFEDDGSTVQFYILLYFCGNLQTR